MTKKKWINLIVILFAFFGFVYIMSTIPFCSDDWAWGASVGAQRLASHLEDITADILETCSFYF